MITWVIADNPKGPLSEHFKPGDLITHLDDIFIGGREDIWKQYLTGGIEEDTNKGWCISKWEFADARLAPCDGKHLIAFQHIGTDGTAALARCLEPHSIIAQPITECNCASSQVCIRPAAQDRVLRIRYKNGDKRDTLLWSGDRSVVLEHVRVTTHSPRFWSAATRWVELFMS
jgi:S2P endopeptidase